MYGLLFFKDKTNRLLFSMHLEAWSAKEQPFKVDVGVLKERSTENSGSSAVTFLGDGNALKTVKLGVGAATTGELDVKNVKELLVKVEVVEGSEGNQMVLFGNGTMISK